MSQPTMSAMLSRLRTLFGDPLLVRTERGMVVTQRALKIAAQVQQAIDLIDRAIADGAPFDAAQANSEFILAATESVGLVLMPVLMPLVRERAPSISLTTHIPDLSRVRQDLEEGASDLTIGYFRNTADGLHISPLLTQRLSVIVSGTHPSIKDRITLDQYVAYPHACYRLNRTATSTIESQVEEALARAGRTRQIALSLPSAVATPAVVAASDLIATIPERVARHFAKSLPLKVLRPPLPLDDVEIAMYWHDRMHNNPAHRWLRQLIRDVAADLQVTG